MPWEPSAIVLDLMMPEMDGWQFLDTLRSGPAAGTPVVVVSGSYALDERTRQSGAAAVFSKPFDLMALLETIKRLCDRGGPAPALAAGT
jgi:CheY-like chemotaxis protein